MIITYPDEVTHRAIIKTIKQILDELLPLGFVTIPAITLGKGKLLDVDLLDHARQWSLIIKDKDMKSLIENNMEF